MNEINTFEKFGYDLYIELMSGEMYKKIETFESIRTIATLNFPYGITRMEYHGIQQHYCSSRGCYLENIDLPFTLNIELANAIIEKLQETSKMPTGYEKFIKEDNNGM